jgi:hypothetical protein
VGGVRAPSPEAELNGLGTNDLELGGVDLGHSRLGMVGHVQTSAVGRHSQRGGRFWGCRKLAGKIYAVRPQLIEAQHVDERVTASVFSAERVEGVETPSVRAGRLNARLPSHHSLEMGIGRVDALDALGVQVKPPHLVARRSPSRAVLDNEQALAVGGERLRLVVAVEGDGSRLGNV